MPEKRSGSARRAHAPRHRRGPRCRSDAELRREVDRLLAAHDAEGAEEFMEAPAFSVDPNVGRHFGPYELVRRLDRGGMGAVYLARRRDLKKKVVLKLIQGGMDRPEILRRFLTEREILAQLIHPNIATLHDGGATDDGEPYFVMEHIEGEPIDRYCEDKGLSVPARLRLFRKVCAAVRFAHRHLVVHRDLKPDNILVTAGGEPKLLDFGIA
ncbi:MAG: serine/threonine protein kinase, partial [bacterium]|nr:serine/threonine protein kinase [bacterium]